MVQVYIDGEEVEFNGGVPGEMGVLLRVLQHHVNGDGRVIWKVMVDGVEMVGVERMPELVGVKRMELETCGEREYLEREVEGIERMVGEIGEWMREKGVEVLGYGMVRIGEVVMGMGERLLGLTRLMEGLKGYGVEGELERVEGYYGEVSGAFEGKDVARLYDLMMEGWEGVEARIRDVMKGRVRESIGERYEEESGIRGK